MSQAGIINVPEQSGIVNSVTGTNGVTAFPTTGNVVVSGINATTSTVGVASFNPNNFNVVSGAVSIKQTFAGSLTTTNATPQTLVTVPMALNPAVYLFQLQIVAIDLTDVLGAAWQASCAFRTNGVSPIILGSEDVIIQDDPSFIGNINLNGTSTAFNVIVTGQAGKTYDWVCTGSYILVT